MEMGGTVGTEMTIDLDWDCWYCLLSGEKVEVDEGKKGEGRHVGLKLRLANGYGRTKGGGWMMYR
jgi:hypothetical protein